MKLKYVGVKDFEDAFKTESGVVWAPGVSHEIEDPALAARMLKHPDVFAVDAGPTAKAEKQTPDKEDKPTEQPQSGASDTGNVPNADEQPKAEFIMKTEEGPLVLDALDKDTLRGLVKEAGLKVHHASGEDKMRAALAEAFPVTEAE